ncbi:hypothetical protein ABZS66_57875 [Dactylosporangium sp. NPDC005572]
MLRPRRRSGHMFWNPWSFTVTGEPGSTLPFAALDPTPPPKSFIRSQ